MASQVTSLTIVYSIVHQDADQGKHQRSKVTGLCAENSPVTSELGPVTRKILPFDDVIMLLNYVSG